MSEDQVRQIIDRIAERVTDHLMNGPLRKIR